MGWNSSGHRLGAIHIVNCFWVDIFTLLFSWFLKAKDRVFLLFVTPCSCDSQLPSMDLLGLEGLPGIVLISYYYF